jgi:hypothetical protein
MTEAEWLACTDPRPMLAFLRGKVSDRKMRLFIAACSHRLVGSSEGEGTRSAIAIADLLAETGTLRTARGTVRVPEGEAVIDCSASDPADSLSLSSGDLPRNGIGWPLRTVLERLACYPAGQWRREWVNWFAGQLEQAGFSRALQAGLLRDVVRGAYRPLFFRDAWRRWNGETVRRIAQGIYEDRTFGLMPILHDALLDAGCDEEELLAHCRHERSHVRGCWVIDLILAKE